MEEAEMYDDLIYCLKIFTQILSTKNLTADDLKRIEYVKKILKPHIMSQSIYTYKIEKFSGKYCIMIEDLYQGEADKITVVNNIESVINEISIAEKMNPIDHVIVTRDSAGLWDGWNVKDKTFEILEGTNPYHAINRFIKRNKSNDISETPVMGM